MIRSRIEAVSLIRFCASVSLLFAAGLLSSCATPDAPDFRGRWRPVNKYADMPQAIPLQPAYLFQASPMDGTLKNLLARWAKDVRLSLSYLHPNDYTLHGPVAQIRTDDIHQAVGALSAAYATQGITIAVEPGQIVVRAASPQAAEAVPASESSGSEVPEAP